MSVGCAMRTMNQQLATSFRCARRTLHWFIELIRASLASPGVTAKANACLISFMVSLLLISRTLFRTLNLLREKQGQVNLERPISRSLVVVIEGVVSDLAKQVDRLLAELRHFSHPGT